MSIDFYFYTEDNNSIFERLVLYAYNFLQRVNKYFLIFSLWAILSANNALVAQSDSSKPKIKETIETSTVNTKPAETTAPTPQGNFTVPPIITPLDPPIRKPRRKRVDSLALNALKIDSVRTVFMNDSLAKLQINPIQQNTNNQQLTTNNYTDTTHILSQSENPFDVLRGAATVEKKPDILTNEIVSSPFAEPKTHRKNFNFWVFFFSLFVMAVLVSYGRKSIAAAYNSVTSENTLKQSFRDFLSKSTVKFTINGLYIIFLLSLSIFIFLILEEKNTSLPFGQGTLFLYCCGVVFTVFAIKHFILYCISNIFPIKKETQLYNFVILISAILGGFCLFAINLFIAFGPKNTAPFFINCGVGVLALMYLIRYVRSISIIGKFLTENRFHFLLYICSVEIAPAVIFFKILSKYNFGL